LNGRRLKPTAKWRTPKVRLELTIEELAHLTALAQLGSESRKPETLEIVRSRDRRLLELLRGKLGGEVKTR
jgi:hypothetical protein